MTILVALFISNYNANGQITGVKNLVNTNSGLCLAVKGATQNNGEEGTIWTCDGNADKNWNIIAAADGCYKIQNMNSNLFLAVGAGSRDYGGRVVQYVDQGQQDILWRFIDIGSGVYKIQNKNSGLVLAIGAGLRENGAPLIQWGDEGQQDTKWKLNPLKSPKKPAPTAYTPPAVSKNLMVTLNGIFMGECGNPNDCTHEPVAGEVHIYLVDKTTGAKVLSTNAESTLWNSNRNYDLVCTNYKSASAGNGYGSGDGIIAPESVANNLRTKLFYSVDEAMFRSNRYELVVRFNLGSAHKDNDFASTGYHWLKQGNGKVEAKLELPVISNHERRTIGPYQTDSNRCHEYVLQFDLKVY